MRIVLTAVVLLLNVSVASAQNSWIPKPLERAKTWEGGVKVVFQDSESVSGIGGATLDLDDDTGFGFGLNYNFTNHLALGADFNFTRPRYTATFVDGNDQPVAISSRADVITTTLRGTYNVLAGPFTPYLEGGLGWTYIDSNVANQPPIIGCFFDPFFGFVCRNFVDTYDDSSFSYSAGAGLRWDITPDVGIRAGLSRLWLDLDSGASADLNVGQAEFFWRF